MTIKQAEKFIGKKVQVFFEYEWFNEAVQQWVTEEEPHVGILQHPTSPRQKRLYCLEQDTPTCVFRSCWSANRMKRIVEVKE